MIHEHRPLPCLERLPVQSHAGDWRPPVARFLCSLDVTVRAAFVHYWHAMTRGIGGETSGVGPVSIQQRSGQRRTKTARETGPRAMSETISGSQHQGAAACPSSTGLLFLSHVARPARASLRGA